MLRPPPLGQTTELMFLSKATMTGCGKNLGTACVGAIGATSEHHAEVFNHLQRLSHGDHTVSTRLSVATTKKCGISGMPNRGLVELAWRVSVWQAFLWGWCVWSGGVVVVELVKNGF